MTHIALFLVSFLISSSSSSSSSLSSSSSSSLPGWGAAGASVFCTWTKVLSNGEVYRSFLRGGAPSVRLYHSAWSGPARALLGCTWSDDAAVINDYLSLCLERAQHFSHQLDVDVDLDSMLGAEGQCVSLADPGEKPVVNRRRRDSHGQDERSEVRSHPRVKRGFIVPGTLWCGSGNKAPSYANLGVFSDTDSCCREHDQCKHTILSFHSQFGVFNTNIFTMSHCDCDNKFHRCLKEANDSISDVVGYTFFNLLKMHCFEFSHRLQCTQRNWFGMCKETKIALYAEVHPPTLYESTSPTEVGMNSSITNTTLPADTQLFSVTAAASTVPTPLTSSPSASVTPIANITSTSAVTDRPHRPTSTAEMQPSCSIYKALDECRSKILPQQSRYGLHNPEPRTLYHCNCTSRLFQTLVKQRQLTEVQTLLMGYVSQSCFLPQDCTTGKICTAVLVRADLPQQHQRSGAEAAEEQRHLQALRLKLRGPNSRRAKRKDGAIRLHKLCLRMTRPKQTNRNRNMVRVNENING